MTRKALSPDQNVYEIGRWYRVPCVFGRMFDWERWWPVMGPKHEDAEFIGFFQQHYHVDWRFVPKRFMPRGGNALAYPLHEPSPAQLAAWPTTRINLPLPKPQARRAKCVRKLPPFPALRVPWLKQLEAAHAGCKLKPGLICPHRGIPLASLPTIDGIVTCPGHGLRWNVTTGDLVPVEGLLSTQKSAHG